MTLTVLAWSATKDAGAAPRRRCALSCWWLPSARPSGVSGAAVLCDEAMADYLLQFARHLIYSTAMPPAQAVALSAALGIIRSDEGQQRRDILAARIRQFREGMGEVSLGLTDSVSAIQPLIVGDNARALNLACRLRDAGCWATAIRPPTVPVGSARLRLTPDSRPSC
ncbi:8-amino-7-oxononanoate synthase [Klebsiella pneumoniae]|uniref:8-amino-7-oxononanoate synthase n=1 Tax=Klebsiella pneumoniae TaxID=573 RepID=A0A377XTF1_KLEPN|nr:8-amino-7-oxononanoate synthase [Klebsiella pneumoniae]